MFKISFITAIGFLLANCTNPPAIGHDLTGYYNEYLIALGEADFHQVQCVATFRKGDEFGKAQTLPEKFTVYLDDRQIPLQTDVYPTYTTEISRTGFDGNHKWLIKENNNVVLEIPFHFSSFKLVAPVDSILGSKDLIVNVSGLKNGDTLECWFDNTDMDNENDRFDYTINNNSIVIPLKDAQSLKQGPYKLIISYIQKKPVSLNKKEIGISDVSYILEAIAVDVKY
jgi:hypothetical protein